MTKALLISIGDYEQNPLSSALNDAFAFRHELVKVGLVAQSDIGLLTSLAWLNKTKPRGLNGRALTLAGLPEKKFDPADSAQMLINRGDRNCGPDAAQLPRA